jgi:hypothetical protein
MPGMTPEQFAQMVKAVADGRRRVKNVRIDNYSVVVDILSKSGKSVYEWWFKFDETTGSYVYRGAFAAANEPVFFGDAVRRAFRGMSRP